MTHSLYVKLSKNSEDYGEPDITYQLAGSAEQRPLGKNWGTLICSPKISHKENVADTRDIYDIPNLFTLKNT